jgi:hypothetical protein
MGFAALYPSYELMLLPINSTQCPLRSKATELLGCREMT